MSKSAYIIIASFIILIITAVNYSIALGDSDGTRSHGGGHSGGYSGFSGGHK